MKHLISAINRAIKIEEGKAQQRQMMIANQNKILLDQPLPMVNEEYLQELNTILPLLEYLAAPVKDWTEIVDGSINVPDELDPLINKIAWQLKFHTISGKGEAETICDIAFIAQKFFHQYRPTTS